MLTLYIDTREQKPLTFKSEYISTVKHIKLPYGDYGCSIGEVICPVVFERKSLSDLFGTMGKGHERFKREVNRSIDDGRKLVIIVEKPLTAIVKGYRRSKMKGIAVARTLFTYMVKHHVPFVCCTSRVEMSLYITEFYYAWSKLYGETQR